ncbi:MAG: N-acetylglutamate synthase [Actinomycetota bacterium]|jgi:GNAT superfamily N-acetyltransferase|nr:N-acetylglutamate synthase [Actinomycetota bacterium]
MTDEAELARRRTLMGRGVMPWLTESHMWGEQTGRSWALITGTPTPDINLVLVYDDDPQLLTEPLAQIDKRGCPSLLMLAGPGKQLAGALPSSYTGVGEMPIMAADLATVPRQADLRVRQATAADIDAVADLISEAYGFDRDIGLLAAAPLRAPSSGMSIYLLEDEGQPVSTVTMCRAEDVAGLWCMGTPERYGRRGYGRALLAAVLQIAYDDGATLGLLGATPAGLPLYEATGWRTEETWELFADAVSEQFSH